MISTRMHWPPRRRSNRTGSRSRPPASAPNTAPQPFLSDSHWLLIADVLADPPPSAKGGRLVFTGKKSCLSASTPNAGAAVGYGRKGNGTTIMLMVDGEGTPLSAFTTAANISEVHAIEILVDARVTSKTPQRLMYDKAADADWLRETLGVRGIALICPHRANRQKPSVQDGRAMRRYKRRFKVERSISWLHNSRRLLTRWEYDPELFEGFVHLAWLFTLLKRF